MEETEEEDKTEEVKAKRVKREVFMEGAPSLAGAISHPPSVHLLASPWTSLCLPVSLRTSLLSLVLLHTLLPPYYVVKVIPHPFLCREWRTLLWPQDRHNRSLMFHRECRSPLWPRLGRHFPLSPTEDSTESFAPSSGFVEDVCLPSGYALGFITPSSFAVVIAPFSSPASYAVSLLWNPVQPHISWRMPHQVV